MYCNVRPLLLFDNNEFTGFLLQYAEKYLFFRYLFQYNSKRTVITICFYIYKL